MTRTDPVRVIVRVEARPSVEEVEVDRADWDAMTVEDRTALLDGFVENAINNAGGAGWHIDDPDDLASVS